MSVARRVIAGVAVLLAVLTACAQAPRGDAPETSAPGFPATIAHKFGATTVPAPPRRVVSLGYTDQDAILALGVVPVAIRDFFGGQPSATWPWARPLLRGTTPEVLPLAEVSVEKVAALRPDLIVAVSAGLTRELYETYSRIAPTIVQPAGYVDHGTPWQETTRIVGAALGRGAEAERLVTALEARFAEVRSRHPAFAGKRLATGRVYVGDRGQYMVWSSQDPRARFFSALGFVPIPDFDQRAGSRFYADISVELLGLLDHADLVVWITSGETERASIAGLPGYGALRTVRDGRSMFVGDEMSGALSFSSVLSLPRALDVLPAELAARLPG